MWRHLFWHTFDWKERLQTVGVLITVCTTIIIALVWFLDTRGQVKEIPDMKSTVQKHEETIRELSLKLENLEKQLRLEERIGEQERQVQALQEQIERLTSQKQETLSTSP